MTVLKLLAAVMCFVCAVMYALIALSDSAWYWVAAALWFIAGAIWVANAASDR